MTNNLTACRLIELLDYDPATGVFKRVKTTGSRWKSGDLAGSIRKDGYVQIKIDGVLHLAHRLAYLFMTGSFPELEIDHIDGNTDNNKWMNLREVSRTVNSQNLRKAPSGKKYSNLIGAHWCKQRNSWKSSIRVNGINVNLGCFDSDQKASDAYLSAKRAMHEGCTI